jgi:biotin carboxyl carrier protein
MSDRLTPGRVRVAERIGFGLYVLIAVVLVGRQVGGGIVGAAAVSPPPIVATTAVATARPSTAAPATTASPSVVVTVTPTLTAEATRTPLAVAAYENGGRRFAAIAVPVGATLTSPIVGTVSVVVYQFLGGQVRIGSNIPSEPYFPYVAITSADRRVILRPGALNQDVQLVVKDGEAVSVGSPLFRIMSEGASSWRTFYDRSVTAQVIASVAALPSGQETDPVALFGR